MIRTQFVPAKSELSLILDLLGLGRQLRHGFLVRRQSPQAVQSARPDPAAPSMPQRFVLPLLVLSFLFPRYNLVFENRLIRPALVRVVVVEDGREGRPRRLDGCRLRVDGAAEVPRVVPLLEHLHLEQREFNKSVFVFL